jgi:cellulose synthase/poly-beta-1,6-N-acetylglucosamine synthase-like glycosyltransferase
LSSASRSSPSVSAVVPAYNEGGQLRTTVHALLATLPGRSEIVIVDDGSTDGCADFVDSAYPSVRVLRPQARLGAAAARNAGAEEARGELLLFCDAHVLPPFGWPAVFRRVLADEGVGAVAPAVSVIGAPALVGYGLVWRDEALNVEWLPRRQAAPYPVPILGGCFLGMRREVFEATGGWDGGLTGCGGEDAELSFRLWLLGYRCMLVPSVVVAHRFRRVRPYDMDSAVIPHNFLRIGTVHFGRERLARLVRCLARTPTFPSAVAAVVDGDSASRRTKLRAERTRDDDWYFEQFGELPRRERTASSL